MDKDTSISSSSNNNNSNTNYSESIDENNSGNHNSNSNTTSTTTTTAANSKQSSNVIIIDRFRSHSQGNSNNSNGNKSPTILNKEKGNTHNRSHSQQNNTQRNSLSANDNNKSSPVSIKDDISVSFFDTYSDNQKIHQHPETGLTSKYVTENLIALVNQILETKEASNPFSSISILKKELLKVTPMLYILGVFLLIIAYGLRYEHGFQSVYLIVQAGLLLLFIVLYLYMHNRELKLEHNETISKARGHLKRYQQYGDNLQDGVTTVSDSISLLSVCRDQRWRKVPINLLIQGDLVSLREGELVPVHLECIEPDFRDIHLQPDEVYTSELLQQKLLLSNPSLSKDDTQPLREKLFQSGRSCFLLKETPCFNQISMSIDEPDKRRPINPVINAINYIYVVIERFLWASVAVSLFANIFRSIFQDERDLVDLLIIRQVNLIIAFSFVMLPCVLLLITYSIGHAKLLALFDVLQERSLKGEISENHPALNFDSDVIDDKIPDIPFKLLLNYWEAILSTKHVAFSHSSHLLHSIASTTVICCIDKEGIVSEPVNTIGEISFLKDELVRLELSSEYSHTQYSITFSDNQWRDHINSLKPLGLDCILNRTCRINSDLSRPSSSTIPASTSFSQDQASKLQLIRDREDTSDSNSQCLCLLAKEIGFSDDVPNQYVRLKEIHTLTQHHSCKQHHPSDPTVEPTPYMISLVSKDINSETLQLLTKGSTELVMENCQQYWDGETLKNFGERERELVRQLYHKWVSNESLKAIAFAYKPIEPQFKKLFSNGSVNSPLVDIRFSSNTFHSRKNSKSHSNDPANTSLRAQIASKSIETQNDKQQQHKQQASGSILTSSGSLIEQGSSHPSATTNTNTGAAKKKVDISPLSPLPSNDRFLSPKTPGNDIVIVVESPLPGSLGPTPKLKKKRRTSNRNNANHPRKPSLLSNVSNLLNLPPVELEFESGNESDGGNAAIKKIQIVPSDDDDDQDEYDVNENSVDEDDSDDEGNSGDEDQVIEMTITELDPPIILNVENLDDEEVEAEYSNNDSETESDHIPPMAEVIAYSESEESDSRKKKKRTSMFSKKRFKSSSSSSKKDDKDKDKKKKKGKKSSSSKKDKKKQKQLEQQQEEERQRQQEEDEENDIFEIDTSTPHLVIDDHLISHSHNNSIGNDDLKSKLDEIMIQRYNGSSLGDSCIGDELANMSLDNNDLLEQLQMNQVFIGMAGMKVLPKPHSNHFVEVLRAAGIRFVYFSDDDRRASTSFANKLGLETDWNCCISLRDPGPNDSQIPEGPSRLPKGISSIRKHLEEVDNVPLLVPMFSDSDKKTKEEMIRILQENGEVVCCIGSALNYDNTSIFCQSDLAFSLEPAVPRCLDLPLSKSDPLPLLTSRNFFETTSITSHLPMTASHIETKRVPSEFPSTHSLCSDITSLPCSLVFHRRTDFNEILKFFHIGRQLLTNTRQCLLFILSASMSLVLMTLLAGILAVSLGKDGVVGEVPMTGLQLMWLEFIIIPLIGFSLLATPEERGVMTTLSPKNNKEFKHIPTFAQYIAIRLVPSILLTTFFFLWSLHSLTGASWANIFGASLSDWDGRSNPDVSYSDALLVSQNIMMFAFVYYLCITSISFIHHTESIRKFNPLRNYVWVGIVILCLSLQIAFSFISLKAIGGIHLLKQVSWELYIVLFAWAIVVIILDEFVKNLYKKWFEDLQLELRLEFDTKLGMHSPI
ncbi:hypothetical protein CYY_009303 [Polysphondylium violaceum]|uniref:Cation-transporting P-type ATPase C-terminal domain-containing protein n=1 Tax=Polysphondylium violaceum TaxID=133409 RepID=A0A8J4PLX9_9MYCE|nr:hypothetical protein CYY_009303 [Polysphondylium violaceum]